MKLEQARAGALPTLCAAVAAALLCAVAAPAAALDASAPPPQTVAQPIEPEKLALAVQRLDGLAEDLLARTGVPGLAVAVVHQGETLYARGFGLRRAGGEETVDAGTVFQLASLSKSVAATVVARQVGIGAVDWQTPVVEQLPWFRLADPWVTRQVTLADLFSHRSGLPDHAGDDLEDLGYGRREILERLHLLPLGRFRADYAYTNFGLTAAAEAVAAASGTDWASLAEQTIYRPLGMASSSSRFADFERRANRATGHVRTAEGFAARRQRRPDAQSPAGGVSASARDFARWMIMVLDEGRFEGRRIVEPAALLQALTAKVVSAPSYAADARPSFYGHGFNVSVQPSGLVTLGHSGAFYLGAGTTFQLVPAAELGIAVFTNGSPIGAAEALAAQFLDIAQFGEVTRDWIAAYGALTAPMMEPVGALAGREPPAVPHAARALQAYVGRYRSAYAGDAEVVVEAGALVLQLGPPARRLRHRLRHSDGDSFYFEAFGENAPEGSRSRVAFEPGPDGAIEGLTVELLDEEGLGAFARLPD